jgi:hypothetical protein
VLDELFAVSTAGNIKLVDVLVAEKDTEGSAWTSEISDLTLEEEIRYGAVIGGLIGLGEGGQRPLRRAPRPGLLPCHSTRGAYVAPLHMQVVVQGPFGTFPGRRQKQSEINGSHHSPSP